jgi:ADP-ribose pyrophosphatase YjhB (NUDIX family)
MTNKKTLITAISISTETDRLLNSLQKKYQKNRSQLLRELIFRAGKDVKKSFTDETISETTADLTNPNTVLRKYYEMISAQSHKPTLVIGIAVINKQKKVLIGLRKTRDQYVRNLSWTFPSGKFTSLNFESEVEKTLLKETGLKSRVVRLIHARLIPDSPEKSVRIVALYYHCKAVSGKLIPGGSFKELKWIPAADVTKFFTTSTCDEIMNFLGTL